MSQAAAPSGQGPAAGPWDYIIVGAGSAGSVLAGRLSEDPSARVLLLEAGPPDTSPLIRMPKGFGHLLTDPKHIHCYPVEAHAGNAGRQEVWLRGKMLGGSSSINGMIYMRGHPADYDDMEREHGAVGWNWQRISACFRRMEDHALGADEWRGTGGPLRIGIYPERTTLSEAVITACGLAGLPRQDDINRPDHEGIAYLAHTLREGRRQSAADAFLAPARSRRNLEVQTGVRVDRLLMNGLRASGVTGLREGLPCSWLCSREVILCAGAIESPRILLLSGIGNAGELRALGITPLAHRPAVGRNLRDHLLYMLQWRLRGWNGCHNREFSGWRLWRNTARYALNRSGPMAMAPYQLGGFFRSRPGLDRPDTQLLVAPYSLDFQAGMKMEPAPGLQMFAYALRPHSVGWLTLRSPDPAQPPRIVPNWLDHPEDRRVAVDAIRMLRRIASLPPLAALIAGETRPGSAVHDDEALLDLYRHSGQSGYHACGTCRMGGDEDGVVDPELRVRGVQGVRVMDLSVAPRMISGNTNGPVMAMAWHAANLITGRQA